MRGSGRFVAVGVLIALLVAGGLSFYASSHPDGLEYVAEKTGFLDTADDSPTADSPFADYGVDGIDNDRLSGGVAGVAGTLVVLVLAGGLFRLVARRRDVGQVARRRADDQPDGEESSSADQGV